MSLAHVLVLCQMCSMFIVLKVSFFNAHRSPCIGMPSICSAGSASATCCSGCLSKRLCLLAVESECKTGVHSLAGPLGFNVDQPNNKKTRKKTNTRVPSTECPLRPCGQATNMNMHASQNWDLHPSLRGPHNPMKMSSKTHKLRA